MPRICIFEDVTSVLICNSLTYLLEIMKQDVLLRECNCPPPSELRPGEIPSLYVLRAFCALLVVIIHTPHEWLGLSLRPLEVCAVPMFFLLSGYFLYSESPDVVYRKAIKSAKKIFLLSVVLNLLYFFLNWPESTHFLASPQAIIKHILLGRGILSVLWFLTDLCTCMLIVALIYRCKLNRYFWLSLFIIPIQVLITVYYPTLGLGSELRATYHTYYHLLPMALPYFCIAFYIRSHQERLLSYRNIWGYCLLGFLLLSYLEQWFTLNYMQGNTTLEYASTVFICISVLVIALRYPTFGAGSTVALIGKEHSANIYYFHMIFAGFLPKLWIILGISFGYYKLGFLIVFPLTLIFSFLVIRLQRVVGIKIF